MCNTLTDDIISKLVLSNVIKQGGKNWEKGNGGVVNVLGHAFDLLWGREAPDQDWLRKMKQARDSSIS